MENFLSLILRLENFMLKTTILGIAQIPKKVV